MTFTSHGRTYSTDEFGVTHQTDGKPFVYDKLYASTYDTLDYTRQNDKLQALRLGFVIGSHGSVPESIMDVGYGNGAFLKACDIIPKRYGKDITGLQVPGIELVDDYIPVDVITFNDCLEHIPDLGFIKDLQCDTLVISLPWCHSTGGWFDEHYKHRKPDEHLHHFNNESLCLFMASMDWFVVAESNHEDIVRTSTGPWKNILSMAFKR